MKVQLIDPTTGEGVDFNNQALAADAIEFAPADTDLPSTAKAVVFDADGTISFKPRGGGTASTGYPVIKGQPLMFIPGRVTAMTGPTKAWYLTGNR